MTVGIPTSDVSIGTSEQLENIMPFVYILKSFQKNKYYIGSTKRALDDRLNDHNQGRVTSTKSLKPWKLMVSREYNSYSQARKIELKLKMLKRKDYIERIVRDGYIKLS